MPGKYWYILIDLIDCGFIFILSYFVKYEQSSLSHCTTGMLMMPYMHGMDMTMMDINYELNFHEVAEEALEVVEEIEVDIEEIEDQDPQQGARNIEC